MDGRENVRAFVREGWQVEPLYLVEVREGEQELVVVAARRDSTQNRLGRCLHRLLGVVHEQDGIDLRETLRDVRRHAR
ncbi:hypothetical protein D9M70_605930 [compost metagenome]